MQEKNIVLNCPVSPQKIGDALLYGASAKLLNRQLPQANITLMCQHPLEGRKTFGEMMFKAQFLDSTNAGYMALWNRVRSSLSMNHDKKNASVAFQPKQHLQFNLSLLYDKYSRYMPPILGPDKLISKQILDRPSFDAGMVAGHTLGMPSPQSYIMTYELTHSSVTGPIVTFPLSVSFLSIIEKLSFLNRSLVLSKLTSALEKFDFIFVRGPYSLSILKNNLNIPHVGMALDSGFEIKSMSYEISHNEKFRIIITPRKDYFETIGYARKGLYQLYLNAIVGFIVWSVQNIDCEIILTSQTNSSDAIEDILTELHRKGYNSYLKSLKVILPKSILESYKLYKSSDFVLTSYYHAGVNALASGVPAIFVMPFSESKLLDTLAFLGLPTKVYGIDLFDDASLSSSTFIEKAAVIIDRHAISKRMVESAVNQKMPTLEYPVSKLKSFLN